MIIVERLKALRKLMEERGIDVYIIPTSDFHETEYVGEHFKARTYMSNFTGSAGTLVVAMDGAGLWSDGRYFIQAARELEGTGIDLMKSGEEGTPLMAQYIYDHVRQGKALGFDGRVINTRLAEALQGKIKDKDATISCEEDLVGMIWEDRPQLPKEKAFLLDEKYCGVSSKDKIKRLRERMDEVSCDTHIISSLDDIAYLLNLRGKDIASYPVVLSYLIVDMKTIKLCLDLEKLDDSLLNHFAKEEIELFDYEEIYNEVAKISNDAKILMDKTTVNFKISNSLPVGVQISDQKNPSQLWKAIKNETELENNRLAHIKDGVAVTNFMYWLKHNIGKEEISEVSAARYLKECRRAQANYLEVSFDTISAYNANGAMMHYHAEEDTCATLKAEGFLLVDSGGQYLEGTTDITRTFVLGPVSNTMRFHFTTVLRSMIRLASANFLYGCNGMNLDILARGPIWDLNIDYKCGTGHGIGFVLNVHEAPNGFRWQKVAERNDSAVFEEGMVTTNEPGIYLENQYGIRHENEMITRKGEKNGNGQFMHFETITFAPFDIDGIDASVLANDERLWLNEYHKEVYDKISPYLSDEVASWLKEATRAI